MIDFKISPLYNPSIRIHLILGFESLALGLTSYQNEQIPSIELYPGGYYK
jgi:hypothetical protein